MTAKAVHKCRELCQSRGGRPGLPVPNKPYGLCGRNPTLNWTGVLVCHCAGSWFHSLRVLGKNWGTSVWAERDGVCPLVRLGRITTATVGLGFSGNFPAGIVVCRCIPIVDYGLVQHEWQAYFSAFLLCVAVSTVLPALPWRPLVTLTESSMVTAVSVHAAPAGVPSPACSSALAVVHWACSKCWMSFWTGTTAASGRWLDRVVAVAATYWPAAAFELEQFGSFSVGSGPLAWSELQACRCQCRLK